MLNSEAYYVPSLPCDPSHQKSLSRRGPDLGRSVASVCVWRVLLDLVETRELWLGMVVNYLRPLRVCSFLGALQTIVVRALSDRQDRGGICFGIVRASKTTAATRYSNENTAEYYVLGSLLMYLVQPIR